MSKAAILLFVFSSTVPLLVEAKAPSKAKRATLTQPIANHDTKPTIVNPTAPEQPEGLWGTTDKFQTGKDAHGHDYDVRTGSVICLDKPFPFRDSLYGAPTMRKIPLGHVQCISRDREFTTI